MAARGTNALSPSAAPSRVPTDHALNVARRNAPNAQRFPESLRAVTAGAPSRTTQRYAMSGGQGAKRSESLAGGRQTRTSASLERQDVEIC